MELLVPEVGVEPTRPKGPRDFESRASANSATLAKTTWRIIRTGNSGVKLLETFYGNDLGDMH